MENNKARNKEFLNKINQDNYLFDQNSNFRKNQAKNISIFKPQPRGKTPNITRVKDNFNRQKNNLITVDIYKENEENYLGNNKRNNYIFNNGNISSNNVNLNNTVNYTMRGSDYSNYSGSGFTAMTQLENLDRNNDYYKVLFQQVRGHNIALLDQIKKDKNLSEIIKALEKENKRLNKENKKLKDKLNKSKTFHSNSDGEEDKIDTYKNILKMSINQNKEKDNNKKLDGSDINYVLLLENNNLKDELKKLFKKNEELHKNNEENEKEKQNLLNDLQKLEDDNEIKEKDFKNQIDELIKNNSLLEDEKNNLNKILSEKDEFIDKIQLEKDELNSNNKELAKQLNELNSNKEQKEKELESQINELINEKNKLEEELNKIKQVPDISEKIIENENEDNIEENNNNEINEQLIEEYLNNPEENIKNLKKGQLVNIINKLNEINNGQKNEIDDLNNKLLECKNNIKMHEQDEDELKSKSDDLNNKSKDLDGNSHKIITLFLYYI